MIKKIHILTMYIIIAIGLCSTAIYPQAKAPVTAPALLLQKILSGERMIQALGPKISEVAKRHGMSVAELKSHSHDHTLHADHNGRLVYLCEGMEVEGISENIIPEETSFGNYDLTQAFFLNSRPGADLTIYLDFDGHTTSGTYWNSNFNSGADFYTPPYDTDGNTASFSNNELLAIIEIWKRVLEDFAAWDVNVTTQDPGADALIKSSSSDTQYGIRVCIGGSSYDWYGNGAGGVAYLNSFSWSTDTPTYVFEAQLGNGNIKYTAEATSHEIGHTLSLSHDGQTDGTAYYQGHGNWAPIMGVGYYKSIVQWSKGDYANANNTQDDLARIANYIPLREDYAADDITTSATISNNELIYGIIGTRDDADLYSFQTEGGPANFTANTAGDPDLDIALALYDGSGYLISEFDNSASMSSSLSVDLTPGTYFIAVDGSAPGDPVTSYNDYASIGQFELTADFNPSNNIAPVSIATTNSPTSGFGPLTIQFDGSNSYDSDGSIVSYEWEFGDGNTSTEISPTHTYNSFGVFYATLIVRDDKGASATDLITITVEEEITLDPLAISNLTMSYSGNSRKGYQAVAEVTVINASGRKMSNVQVIGSWSGLVNGSSTATTSRKGTAKIKSPKVRQAGTITFTITDVLLEGYEYDSSLNDGPSSVSVTIP